MIYKTTKLRKKNFFFRLDLYAAFYLIFFIQNKLMGCQFMMSRKTIGKKHFLGKRDFGAGKSKENASWGRKDFTRNRKIWAFWEFCAKNFSFRGFLHINFDFPLIFWWNLSFQLNFAQKFNNPGNFAHKFWICRKLCEQIFIFSGFYTQIQFWENFIHKFFEEFCIQIQVSMEFCTQILIFCWISGKNFGFPVDLVHKFEFPEILGRKISIFWGILRKSSGFNEIFQFEQFGSQ